VFRQPFGQSYSLEALALCIVLSLWQTYQWAYPWPLWWPWWRKREGAPVSKHHCLNVGAQELLTHSRWMIRCANSRSRVFIFVEIDSSACRMHGPRSQSLGQERFPFASVPRPCLLLSVVGVVFVATPPSRRCSSAKVPL